MFSIRSASSSAVTRLGELVDDADSIEHLAQFGFDRTGALRQSAACFYDTPPTGFDLIDLAR